MVQPGLPDAFPDKEILPVLREERIPPESDRQVLADDYTGVFRGPCHNGSFVESFGDHERDGLSNPAGIE